MELVDEIVELCGADYAEYEDPTVASGCCYAVVKDIGDSVSWDGVEMVYTRHYNGLSPVHGQSSDHYALHIPELDTVIDYTMRQFDPASAFPYIGTLAEWSAKLAHVWGYHDLVLFTGVNCDGCDFIEGLCRCCEHCMEPPNHCECASD